MTQNAYRIRGQNLLLMAPPEMRRRRLPLVALAAAALVRCADCGDAPPGDKLQFHSFEPPFDATNAQGERILSADWKVSGSTEVNKNFARLTPDRQSKSGGVWSRRALGTLGVSAELKFRISGQGEKFYGDGMALWVTHTRSHRAGGLHGFTEQFVGFGVIFDTFKNAEMSHVHKDVMLVYNTGKESSEAVFAQKRVRGCDGEFRYHNKRADFSVDAATRARVVVDAEAKTVAVSMDWKNTGAWAECATLDISDLYDGWLKEAHVGLTASTGQLADNHDVLSFAAYIDADSHAADEARSLAASSSGDYGEELRFERGPSLQGNRHVRRRFSRLASRVSRLASRVSLSSSSLSTFLLVSRVPLLRVCLSFVRQLALSILGFEPEVRKGARPRLL